MSLLSYAMRVFMVSNYGIKSTFKSKVIYIPLQDCFFFFECRLYVCTNIWLLMLNGGMDEWK